MFNRRQFHSESGNTALIVLAVIVVAAIGGLAYFSGKIGKEAPAADNSAIAAAAAQTASAAPADPNAPEVKPPVLKPGNPVVAKMKGGEVTRLDVFNFIQDLPPQTRQMPLEQLYPLALEQVINSRIIAAKTKNVNLDSDEEVKKRLAAAKTEIVRGVYIEKQVSEKISEDRLKSVYEEYVKNFPDIQDVKARHILVKEEGKAKDLIKQIEGGASFEDLAKANSTDGTAQNGGDLGYFAKTDVVPAFGDAAFALNIGEFTKKPVKTDFGYHVIKVEEKRKRPPASYDDIKPYLETQVRRQILDETIQAWRKDADIQRFDINGDAIEPSAGEPAPAGKPTE
ncbi:MAG TPA: peptidylprolyl isomerase [Alphaproteobacteria bacterium]|nr:peptidylprolyl isomerase [Alphaproteobacteria bacterium]